MRLLAYLYILALSVQPALADWISQGANDANATGLWIGAPPQPGINCPTGTVFCLWVPNNNDLLLSDYQISSQGQQIYMPPKAPAPVEPPNPTAALMAIQSDSTIPAASQIPLGTYGWLLLQYPNGAAGVRAFWAGLKQAFAGSWLTPAVAAAVEADAAKGNITLNPGN